MPRIARTHLERGNFHVLNRGNHRQTLFRQEEDYALFLELLVLAETRFDVTLWGYCLMSNHWHLVVEVEKMGELSRWVHWICNRHVRLVHRERRQLGGGHIYQGRYKSFPIQDENYLHNVLRYVEANPLRAKLVARAQDWPWSSLSSAPVKSGLVELPRPKLQPWPRSDEWQAEVNRPLALDKLQSLQQSVIRGTPQGNPDWVKHLAAEHDMESTLRPRGRPRKVAVAL
jgi:putative transposase